MNYSNDLPILYEVGKGGKNNYLELPDESPYVLLMSEIKRRGQF